MQQHIEIMDTTLRDGEQTNGVSFLPHEKLHIAKQLLRAVHVDRVEVASARVSEGEHKAVSKICQWAANHDFLHRVEVLGFVDGHTSIDWIHSCGGRVINLLCKGSRKHCTHQLKKTLDQHVADIIAEVQYADSLGMTVNVYLEDWTNGMREDKQYVFDLVDALQDTSIRRYMLPDTLGVLNPQDAAIMMAEMRERYPALHFDFHAHNDYDLAIANVFVAIQSGFNGIHTAVNGLGERAGNAPLSSVQAVLKDHFHYDTRIDEHELCPTSKLVESYSGIAMAPNSPITGDNVFTQVAGVHADGDNKNNLYCNALLPQRFGRQREYALGKTSGKANILKNLEAFDLQLTPEETRLVTERIIALGDRKQVVTREDLPYIVSDVLQHNQPRQRVRLLSYVVTTAFGLRPTASFRIEIDNEIYEMNASGDGQYDAFMNGLQELYNQRLGRQLPQLVGYNVTIPPGGRTAAFVQTTITWQTADGRNFRTHGFDADQTEAALMATIKMLNSLED